jgi:RNA polymerase sigma factor (sigma-70 family)
LEDLVADPNAEAPWEAAAAALERSALRQALGRLSDRERAVLTLRFGLDHDQPLTLDEVGRRFELTRERIRQIEAKALSKLRHPCVPGQLRVFAASG